MRAAQLSVPKRIEALDRVAAGSSLKQLLLDSLALTVAVVAPLAAAVRSHTQLEKLSVERNGLNVRPRPERGSGGGGSAVAVIQRRRW